MKRLAVIVALGVECPEGSVHDVETVGWVRSWFGVVQEYRVRARATCSR